MRAKITGTKCLTYAALISALYTAVSLSLMSLAFGPIQFRPAEGMMVLAAFFPFAVPGLFVGCLITNIFSPFGILDIIFGSLATLLVAVLIRFIARYVKNILLRCIILPFVAVIINALIIGAVLYYTQTPEAEAFSYLFFFSDIFISESVSAYLVGVPLLIFFQKMQNRSF
jgi:uncharacterized membrane protein